MTPLRLLNGYLLTILYDYLVTTQKLLTDYTLWLLCVWLMPPLKTLVETMQIFYISELLIMFSLWMLQGLCFQWLISECLGLLHEDFLSMLWLLYVTILYPVVDVFFRRKLSVCPILEGEDQLRLLNYQHNMITKIQHLSTLKRLIFLDLYDNQIEEISGLSSLKSLRVLMLGKNRWVCVRGMCVQYS